MTKKVELDNGLRIVSQFIDGTAFVTIGAMIGAGVRYEETYSPGISNFLREVSLKGTAKYASTQQIFSEIEGRGGSLTSETSKVMTHYLLRIPATFSGLALEILCEMIWNPKLDLKSIEDASTLIVGEIKAVSESPDKLIRVLIDRTMWQVHSLALPRLGNTESIASIGVKELLEFKKTRYSTDSVVFSLAGDTSHLDAVTRMLPSYHDLKRAATGAKNLVIEPSPLTHAGPRVRVQTRAIGRTYVALGVPVVNSTPHLRYALAVMSKFLGGGRGARLSVEMKQRRNLAYKVSSEANSYGGMGDLVIRATVHSNSVVDSLGFLLQEISKLSNGISADELGRAKSLVTESLLFNMEDTTKAAFILGEEELVSGSVTEVDRACSIIESLTPLDIQQIARQMFSRNNLCLAVVGPFDDEREFVELLELSS